VRTLLPLLLLPACAPGVWDARIFPCDEVHTVEAAESYVEVTEEISAPRDDCFVEVRQLEGFLGIDEGVARGSDLFVRSNDPTVALVLSDAEIYYDAGGRFMEGDAEQFVWDPLTEDLQLQTDAAFDVTGPFDDLFAGQADDEADAPRLTFRGEADTLTGSFDYVDLWLSAPFERLIVVSSGDALVAVPTGWYLGVVDDRSGPAAPPPGIEFIDHRLVPQLYVIAEEDALLQVSVDGPSTPPEPTGTTVTGTTDTGTVTGPDPYELVAVECPGNGMVLLQLLEVEDVVLSEIRLIVSVAGDEDGAEKHSFDPQSLVRALQTWAPYEEDQATQWGCDDYEEALSFTVETYGIEGDLVSCKGDGADPAAAASLCPGKDR